MMRILVFITCFLFVQNNYGQSAAVIPYPEIIQEKTGTFYIDQKTPIVFKQPQLKPIAAYLKEELLSRKGLELSVVRKTTTPSISLELNENQANTNKDRYHLNVTSEKIIISASHPQGIFYGVVSLLQMTALSADNKIGACSINDAPSYSWRGFMLDESRHFFGKEKVKSILNWMAFYKLNTFHWHLTDEPAWRIDIHQYPRLALEGGKGDYLNPNLPARYYTQQDIKEIVDYAAARFIQVIPEIDMPGHATAANRAYPQYSGGGSKEHPDFTFNPGNEETYRYLSNILKEVHLLFPSNMIHLGGDEVSFGNEKWKSDPDIQKLKTKYGLKDEKEVEKYFMKRMAGSVYKWGAKVLVWDEMINAGLPTENTIIFWWRHDHPELFQSSLAKGYETVICPRLPFYFDFVQDSTHKFGRKWDKKFNPVEAVYQFDADQLIKTDKTKVLGIQANLWTETVSDEKRLDYLLFPRIAALAETSWTDNQSRDLQRFMDQLKKHLSLYKAAGLYYYNPFNTTENPEPSGGKKQPLTYKD